MEPEALIAATRWEKLKGVNGPAGEVGELLRGLLRAGSRDEALDLAGELLDQVTHDAVPVTEAGAPVVEVLASLLSDRDFRWKADAVSTLDGIQRRVGGWQAVSLFGRANRREKHTAEVVRSAVPAARPLLDSPDPETRAMAAQFLGNAAPEPAQFASELRARFDAERDTAVQAVLAEAYVEAVIRAGGEAVALDDPWLSEELRAGEPAVRFRIARALLDHPGAGDKAMLRRVVSETAAEGMAAIWPAEA